MKLFLSGGGEKEESIELDKKFVASLDLSKPLLYVPIAINSKKHSYQECLKWIRGQFQPLEFDNFIMWTESDLNGKTINDFEQFGGIYIGGGNTFKLLKELKEFGTFEILRELAQKSIPIYGGSAGAIIFAKTIIPALSIDENLVGLTDFTALNLVNNYEIWCHYDESMNLIIKSYMKKFDLKKIITIPENAGLYVNENDIEVVGQSKVFVFKENTKTEFTLEEI